MDTETAGLSREQFEVLHTLISTCDKMTFEQVAQESRLSVEDAKAAIDSCEQAGFIKEGRIAEKGVLALEPYRVKNAIIMAAGMSSRFAPVSYERPKGTIVARGEVLIERQIRQLLEAGITDITMVVGYRKEYYFYLAPKFGVKLVYNPEYDTANNSITLWRVRDQLDNTYICSSDDYFVENPFERYVWKAYYAVMHDPSYTEEWCAVTDDNGRITSFTITGQDAWAMVGHAYFDRKFSKAFLKELEKTKDLPEISGSIWEELVRRNFDKLDMEIHEYPLGSILEFDSLDELMEFDPDFLENVSVTVFDDICSVLKCSRRDIHSFVPINQGITNLSCRFKVRQPDGNDIEYVYRYPGAGTEKLVDRQSEVAGLELARSLGIDDTFIYADPVNGWKISRFIADARDMDPHSDAELKQAMEICRRLHESSGQLARHFDYFDEGLKYERLFEEHGKIEIPGYFELKEKVQRLKNYADADGFPTVVSHNDFFSRNFLVTNDGNMRLIDWEYAGMSDEASDIGTFVLEDQLDDSTADKAIEFYLGRPATFEEHRHFWAYVVMAGWCWYVWSLEKESEGESTGEWLYIYYSVAVNNLDRVLGWYEDGESS